MSDPRRKHVDLALQGRIPIDRLSDAEADLYLEEFIGLLWEPTSEEERFFEDRRRRGLGVGIDSTGQLVEQTLEG